MRVSTSQIFNTGTIGIQNLQSGLYTLQNQISTGRKVLTPADDPIAASQALEVSQSKAVNKQFLDNQANASSKLGLLDSTLSSVGSELQSIYEKAVAAGNGSYDSSQRGMIATELKQRMQNLIGLANTSDGTGLYIFSGFQSTTQPFQVNAGGTPPYALGAGSYVSYNGDSGNEILQVSASQAMATSENGQNVFMQVKDSQGNVSGRSIFDGLQNLVNMLDPASGVPFTTAAYSTSLGDLSNAISHVSTVQASVGARMNGLDSMTSSGQDAGLIFESKLSDLQDLDYTAAITQLSRSQMQLQAAQLSFKQTSQLSLFNIL